MFRVQALACVDSYEVNDMRLKLLGVNFFAIFVMVIAMLFAANTAIAQTSSFTYQGRLTDGGSAANGNYDLQFAIFDSTSAGSQIGSTQVLPAVQVSSGIFS